MAAVQKDHDTKLPKPGEEPNFLPHPLMDHLLESVVALGAELWIERDRRMTLERLLEAKGVLSREEIEDYRADDEDAAARSEARIALVHRTLGTLKRMKKSG